MRAECAGDRTPEGRAFDVMLLAIFSIPASVHAATNRMNVVSTARVPAVEDRTESRCSDELRAKPQSLPVDVKVGIQEGRDDHQ